MLNEIIFGLNIATVIFLALSIVLILKFKRFEKNHIKEILNILAVVLFLFTISVVINSYNGFQLFFNIPISFNTLQLITRLTLIPLTAVFALVAISALRQ